MPSHIVEIWDKALQEMVRDPEFISRLKDVGSSPFYQNATGTKEAIMKEIEEVNKLWGLE